MRAETGGAAAVTITCCVRFPVATHPAHNSEDKNRGGRTPRNVAGSIVDMWGYRTSTRIVLRNALRRASEVRRAHATLGPDL